MKHCTAGEALKSLEGLGREHEVEQRKTGSWTEAEDETTTQVKCMSVIHNREDFRKSELSLGDSTYSLKTLLCRSHAGPVHPRRGQIFKAHLELTFNDILTARSSLNLPHLQNKSQHHTDASKRGHDWSTIDIVEHQLERKRKSHL